MGLKRLLLFITISIGCDQVLSARILLLPYNTYSHVKLMTLSSTELLRAGHQVWMLSSLPPAPHNITHGQVRWIPIELLSLKELLSNVSCVSDTRDCYKVFFTGVRERVLSHCKDIMTNTSLLEELRNMEFNLVIFDGIQAYRCISILPYMLNITSVSLSMQHNAWTAGVPALPSVEPHQLTAFTNDMNFLQRMANTFIYIVDTIFYPFIEKQEDLLLRTLMPSGPHRTVTQVMQNTTLWLTFTEPTCLDYPRSTAPHYVEINVPTPYYDPIRVPTDLQVFMDDAKEGLVVVIFGCLMSEGHLPSEVRDIFIETFKSFPQRFVLRHGPDESFNKSILPPNIYPMEQWVPLDEVLNHPSTRGMISHSGAISMNEAIFNGVPVLVIPFLADQAYNAKRAVRHGWGVALDKSKLSIRSLTESLRELLYNPAHTDTARFCKSILHTIPRGEESVAFWVDHLLTYGWRHLYSRDTRMSMGAILMLDVNLAIMVAVIIVIFFTFKFLMACALIWGRTKRKYPSFFYCMSPIFITFFVITMLHSFLTSEV